MSPNRWRAPPAEPFVVPEPSLTPDPGIVSEPNPDSDIVPTPPGSPDEEVSDQRQMAEIEPRSD